MDSAPCREKVRAIGQDLVTVGLGCAVPGRWGIGAAECVHRLVVKHRHERGVVGVEHDSFGVAAEVGDDSRLDSLRGTAAQEKVKEPKCAAEPESRRGWSARVLEAADRGPISMLGIHGGVSGW